MRNTRHEQDIRVKMTVTIRIHDTTPSINNWINVIVILFRKTNEQTHTRTLREAGILTQYNHNHSIFTKLVTYILYQMFNIYKKKLPISGNRVNSKFIALWKGYYYAVKIILQNVFSWQAFLIF